MLNKVYIEVCGKDIETKTEIEKIIKNMEHDVIEIDSFEMSDTIIQYALPIIIGIVGNKLLELITSKKIKLKYEIKEGSFVEVEGTPEQCKEIIEKLKGELENNNEHEKRGSDEA